MSQGAVVAALASTVVATSAAATTRADAPTASAFRQWGRRDGKPIGVLSRACEAAARGRGRCWGVADVNVNKLRADFKLVNSRVRRRHVRPREAARVASPASI